MITGFNTDIVHNGVTYHVQTEDKGLDTPLILSLIFVRGEILASKRSHYDDLLARGFNQEVLAERLQRQHKLICAAIHAGRIEDLKRMTQRAAAETRAAQAAEEETKSAPTETPVQHESQAEREEAAAPPQPERIGVTRPLEPVATDFAQAAKSKEALHLNLLEEREFRAGEFVTLRIRVSRGSGETRNAVPDVPVGVKILGTTFRPLISTALTDRDGVAIVFAALPLFTSGRAAVLIRVAINDQEAEIRRIIHHA
ncbi:MAG: hypothetical protein WCB68_02850 [Pyrinomonadaceae bacterium]